MIRSIILQMLLSDGTGRGITLAQTQTSVNVTTIVITKPTGTVQNDLMLAIMASDNANTWTGDTGWTEIADQGALPSLRMAYKVAGASEGSSYTFTSSNNAKLSGCILTIPGYQYDAVGTFASAADPVVAPSVTASATSGLLIAAFAGKNISLTFTTPSGMAAVCSDSEGNRPSYTIFMKSIDAGATGTISSSCGTGTEVTGALIALKHV